MVKGRLRRLAIDNLTFGIPNGSRTHVARMRILCPRPLDDRDSRKTRLRYPKPFYFARIICFDKDNYHPKNLFP